MISKETRYGLSLEIATVLHAHRVGEDRTVTHLEADEWWCCVQAITAVVERFLEGHGTTPAARQLLRPGGAGFILDCDYLDVDVNPMDIDDAIAHEALAAAREREAC